MPCAELEGDDAFDEVAATLDRFETLSVQWVIPGHGAPFADVAESIARARTRLDTFVKDPHKHALHAAKVLVKFRLLETQAESWDALLAWLSGATYFDEVRRRHFGGANAETWLRGLVDDMCRRGALQMRDGMVFNGV
jgi:hypothetical protein